MFNFVDFNARVLIATSLTMIVAIMVYVVFFKDMVEGKKSRSR